MSKRKNITHKQVSKYSQLALKRGGVRKNITHRKTSKRVSKYHMF